MSFDSLLNKEEEEEEEDHQRYGTEFMGIGSLFDAFGR